MATTTTRLGLDKPDYADAADVAVLNQNFDDIDNAVGMKVVTSTTRPATPWNGQIIFETDTNYTLVWDSAGAAWKQIGGAAIVCTSSTRPASPLNGQLIYETDTRQLLVYSTAATAWRLPFLDYNVADFTALAALTGMISGSRAFVVEGDVTMVFDGSAWVQQNEATFASAAARDTAYAKASNAYRIQGARVFRTDTGFSEQYYNVYNSSTNTIGYASAGWVTASAAVFAYASRTNTGQSIPNAAYTLATFNSFSATGITLNSTSAPSAFTVPYAGFYNITFHCHVSSWSTTAGTTRNGGVNKNSASWGVGVFFNPGNASTTSGAVVQSAVVKLAANDVIRFWQYQDSGGSATSNDFNVSITWLRPASV
jgi:hypothetical protein